MTGQKHRNRKPDRVSAALVEFADSLKPSDHYIHTGKKLCSNVFKMLQHNRDDVSKTYIGGSVGKKTSIIYPDFDCVVFLNNRNPPLENEVKEFEELLKESIDDNDFGIVENTLKTTSLTVTLEFINGVEMDLLPATNFYAEDPDKQHSHVMSKIRNEPEKHSMYSSSLAQTQIKYIKEQSSTTHQLIRLAKYWFKLCTLDQDIYGSSLLVEILCVDVAFDLNPTNRPMNRYSFHLLPAFRLFLEKVSRLKTLKIGFCHQSNKWLRVPPNDFRSARFKNCFHEEIITRPNFILEPSNPYNDLAKNITDSSFERLTEFSTEMLLRLDYLESPDSNKMKTVFEHGKVTKIFIHFENFFKPFIMSLREYYPPCAIPTYFSIDYQYKNYYAHENAHERDPIFFSNNKLAKRLYKTVMNNLLFLIRGKAVRKGNTTNGLSFTDGITDVDNGDNVRLAVNTFIKSNFPIDIRETSHEAHHANHDVTLTIPYRLVQEEEFAVYAVRFSMNWSENVEYDTCPSNCVAF